MALSIDLEGRRAIVTGVSSGIGAGIARALAQAGCDVAGCALDAADSDGARDFAARVGAHGRRAAYLQADVADGSAARGFVCWAAEEFGGIDLVISNAGRNVFTGAEHATDEAWQANLDLNLAAHWRVAQAAKPFLDRSTQPVIVVMASNQAFSTIPGCFPYNVAKAGLRALVQSLAIEWGPQIRTVGIAPGFIDTPMNAIWFDDAPGRREQTERLHPVGRIGTVEEVGALCAFVCSPLAGFISGTTILMDGGRSAVLQDGLASA